MFIIEGNIGVGKTTLLKKIKDEFPYINTILEPVDQWNKGLPGKSLLKNFYQNPNRWAYILETFAMVCRVKEYINESIATENKIMERSIFSGHYCFAKNDYINGYMNELEWQIYKEWFSFLTADKARLPSGFIYLKADPEVISTRIRKRSRISENNITLDYLVEIDKRHDEFLLYKEGLPQNLKNIPVLTLDCNFNFEDNKIYLSTILNKIAEFIKSTHL